MDTFDKVFCSTLTVAVVGSSSYFLVTTPKPWTYGLLVGVLCVACVFAIWNGVATQPRKIAEQRERDLFVASAVRYFRAADESEIGLTGVSLYERALALMAWARYRNQVLDRSAR